nr:zinc finger and BTB domain-containing protein 25 isoform X2 [Geotrypetes seraphini]XP_033807730.1 zinc finger and BTB domain-containing protein 25 isoform X2 [Geotrypetes seraphini]XP_033807731.1 zinc finger and BTB domain-containing protein 25 isoform X2 [Geotrypetes seraphini]XP_033807732.1 zinc finger and BTB domain-containing protein 25 isoform X2 [Geotrypetes seraphini]XP_033807733.1 zinc finger and BTB domain-containing protein 25 isoform X2 [Geotrypetes seraphini]XP_033807734.1 zinc 
MDMAKHSLILLQQLNMQREFGFLCDCTVAIGDVYFKAHRAVLAAFSNYFKMIFIHQTSECIKIQPTDIQPDIFSYLLHIMYTGRGPKQMVDHIRLEEGIRFLHASFLSHAASDVDQLPPPDAIQSSNLYGIQISTAHKTPKESGEAKENPPGGSGNRSAQQGDHPQLQLSLAIGLEGVNPDQQVSHLPSQVSGAVQTPEKLQKPVVSIKQEKCDPEPMAPLTHLSPATELTVPHFPKVNIRGHLCQYCGERFDSRGGLREHLHTHVSGSLPFGVPASILESSDLAEVHESGESAESHRLGSEQPTDHVGRGSLEPLKFSQLSLISKDVEPVELNCNFSLSRKRKISCTVCGHKFLRKSQLLEHVYTHKGKPYRYSRYQRFGNQVAPKFQPYYDTLSDGALKSSSFSQDHLESPDLSDQDSSSSVSPLLPTAVEDEGEPPFKKAQFTFRQDIPPRAVSLLEIESAFRGIFPHYDSPNLHCHYKCTTIRCDSIQLENQRGVKFAHKWLSDRAVTYCKRTGIYWLVFEEGQGMYCFLCRKHNTYNKQNKQKVFNTTPAIRFKKSALQDHTESQQHMLAILAELADRETANNMLENEKEEISMLFNSFLTAYWLSKEEICISKLIPFLGFLKDPCLHETSYFESVEVVEKAFICIGNAIQAEIVEAVQQAACYGLLFGKLRDFGPSDLLLTFIQYVEPSTAEVSTKFLFSKRIMKQLGEPESVTIVKLMQTSLLKLGLPIEKMASIVTDGADALTCKTTGVSAQLKETNPALISFHCLFPQLCIQAIGDHIKSQGTADVEGWAAEIWRLFENSSAMAELYLEELVQARGVGEIGPDVKTSVKLVLQEKCKIRHSSFITSIMAVYNDYIALLNIFRTVQDAGATEHTLFHKISSVHFIGTVYILKDIYPVLLAVTKIFQKGKVNFTTMESSVYYAVHQLNEALNSKKSIIKLKEDLQPEGRLGLSNIFLGAEDEKDLTQLLEDCVSAIKSNLQSRFDSYLPLVSAFSIFNPLLVPAPESTDFGEYGQSEIKLLVDHFYREANERDSRVSELTEEWEKLKLELFDWKNCIPAVVLTGGAMTVIEWCLKHLFILKGDVSHSYPNLLHLAEVCLSMPVTSKCPEKALQAITNLKLKNEHKIRGDLLNSWIHIIQNGPDFEAPSCHHLIYKAIRVFIDQRKTQLQPCTRTQATEGPCNSGIRGLSVEAYPDVKEETYLDVKGVLHVLGL